MEKIKQYKKDLNFSYTLGPFPTFELINSKPEIVKKVILSKDFTEIDKIINLLEENNIAYNKFYGFSFGWMWRKWIRSGRRI